jgi:hypothetical protein
MWRYLQRPKPATLCRSERDAQTTDQPTGNRKPRRHLATGCRLDELADVEISSEDAAYPIESALLPGSRQWLARGRFPAARRSGCSSRSRSALHLIRHCVCRNFLPRTQEYLLRWSGDGGQSFREIVRQQWNFRPARGKLANRATSASTSLRS